jgi:alkyl hydroperoxide reductase subunit F
MYDLIIIGGGPAAVAAGVYAARKQLSTLVIAHEFGGQSIVSPDIQNWIGTISISGDELARSLKAHLVSYTGQYLTILEGPLVTLVEKKDRGFTVKANDGTAHDSRTVLVASGATRRKLTVPGADTFEQQGLTYCATCDGPLFSGMDVAVVGGGNAGFESAAQLLAYVKSVTLLDTNTSFKADAITVKKVLAHPNMTGITNAQTLEVLGEKMVTGLRYRDTASGTEHTLPVQGVFVEIGVVPSTAMVEGLVELDQYKHVKVDPRTQRSTVKGIWAAGDCTDGLYAQNNIAVGDAVKAVEDIYVHLHTRGE